MRSVDGVITLNTSSSALSREILSAIWNKCLPTKKKILKVVVNYPWKVMPNCVVSTVSFQYMCKHSESTLGAQSFATLSFQMSIRTPPNFYQLFLVLCPTYPEISRKSFRTYYNDVDSRQTDKPTAVITQFVPLADVIKLDSQEQVLRFKL